ncbi:la-related protein 4B isoform X5 [Pontoporia blainvillei]|uniref:La-related protein 4B isoform X5 n=1 Tax=Pontoporia blainvillei TaxID=48723 RepID=A0ABX0S8U4_PONBL|nr:la-related protein 4B isoform X5 [Pontoporia blainvillei]
MGCCFSKELSSDNDSEKTGLLEKSVEEKEPENKISKTLSSLFGTFGDIERNSDSGAITATVDQSLNSEKEGENNCINPLKANDCSSLDVSKSDSLLSISLDRINLSSERWITSLNFGNECLPIHANIQESAPNRCDDPGTEFLLGPVMLEEQHQGDYSLEVGSSQLANKAELSLQSQNSSSYQHEDEISIFEDEGCGSRAFEWRAACQVHLSADIRASKAQISDVTCAVRAADVEGVFRNSQEVPRNGESLSGSRWLKSNFISSACFSTCAERESETEDERCVKSSGSHPHRLESAEQESLRANHRETSKIDTGSVQSDPKTAFDWETNARECKVVRSQDVLTCVSSSVAKNPDFETNQVEKNDETCRVNDDRYEDLSLVPALNQSSSPGLDTNGDGDKSHENAALSDLQESDQTAMSTLGLDHSEYESPPENSETEHKL